MHLLQQCQYRLRQCFWFPLQNHYLVLQVPRKGSSLDIKKAYKKLALEWHPDKWRHQTEEERFHAARMFQRIGEAKDVLLDEEKRGQYDETYSPTQETKDFDYVCGVQETYEDSEDIRMRVAIERFYCFCIDSFSSRLKKEKAFWHSFTSLAIPAAIYLMRYQKKMVSYKESALVSWITLLLCHPDGIKNVVEHLSEEEKSSLFSVMAILLNNDEFME